MTRPRYNQVHAVCAYLRKDLKCKGCPSWEDSDYGRVRRGCYALAREVINIVKHGHPHGKKATQRQIREYRRRVALRKKPNLRIVPK